MDLIKKHTIQSNELFAQLEKEFLGGYCRSRNVNRLATLKYLSSTSSTKGEQ